MSTAITIEIPETLRRAVIDELGASALYRWTLEAVVLEGVREGLLSVGEAGEIPRGVKQGRREGLLVTGTLGVLQQAPWHGWLDIEEQIARLRMRPTIRLPEPRLTAIVALAHWKREEFKG